MRQSTLTSKGIFHRRSHKYSTPINWQDAKYVAILMLTTHQQRMMQNTKNQVAKARLSTANEKDTTEATISCLSQVVDYRWICSLWTLNRRRSNKRIGIFTKLFIWSWISSKNCGQPFVVMDLVPWLWSLPLVTDLVCHRRFTTSRPPKQLSLIQKWSTWWQRDDVDGFEAQSEKLKRQPLERAQRLPWQHICSRTKKRKMRFWHR